jgi:hypothetical protein
MGQNALYSPYREMDAGEAAHRWRRRSLAIRLAYALITIPAILILAFITINTQPWLGCFLILAAAVLNSLIYFAAFTLHYNGLWEILHKDCDPCKLQAVLALLPQRNARLRRAYALRNVQCCIARHEYTEAENWMRLTAGGKQTPAMQVVRLNLSDHEAFQLGEAEMLNQLGTQMDALAASCKPKAQIQKSIAAAKNILAGHSAILAGQHGAARVCLTQSVLCAQVRYQQVAAMLSLAQLDLGEGEYANAKNRLQYVLTCGGTTWAAEEARRLLQSGFEQEKPAEPENAQAEQKSTSAEPEKA